jgi:hypothetical protein
MTDKIFTSHKTTGKFIVLNIQIFTTLHERWDNILNQTANSRAYKIWGSEGGVRYNWSILAYDTVSTDSEILEEPTCFHLHGRDSLLSIRRRYIPP